MNFTVTERDKRLLILVSIALVALICWQYLIVPAMNKKQELELERDELERKQEEWESAISDLSGLEKTINENLEERASVSEPYYAYMETYEVDTVITNLALKHGLQTPSLSLTAATAGNVAYYAYYRGETLQSTVGGTYVYIGTAHLDTVGGTEQWTSFLDDVTANMSGLRIKSFHVDTTTYIDENYKTVETQRITADFDVYMCAIQEEACA